jgi:hypothetical protein
MLCVAPLCGAATDPPTGLAAPRRDNQNIHPVGPTRRLWATLGASNYEAAMGRSEDRKFNGSDSQDLDAEVSTRPVMDAVHAELANLNWQSRSKILEKSLHRFHQEGLPLAHLWQGTSSSLSLGINPDRKPGLWFVKRLP